MLSYQFVLFVHGELLIVAKNQAKSFPVAILIERLAQIAAGTQPSSLEEFFWVVCADITMTGICG